MSEFSHSERDADGQSPKAQWETPLLHRLEAGSAEAGANPVNPEGLLHGS